MNPWAHEPEGGVVGRLRSVSHVVGPHQGSGLMGWVGSRQDTSGSRMVPYRSVYQSYTDTGQSSDPSGLVGSLRAISGSDGFPSEHCFGTTGPEGGRRVARLSRIGARLMYTDPLGTPRRPHGPSGAPSGPNGPPADPRRHRRTLFNRSLPGLGGPPLLLAQPGLLLGSGWLRRQCAECLVRAMCGSTWCPWEWRVCHEAHTW